MRHIKMKYRLLLVIFLPTLFLLGFLYTFITKQHSEILKGEDVQVVTVTAAEIIKLNSMLLNEADLSKINIQLNKPELQKEIYTVRQKVDSEVLAIKNSIDSNQNLHSTKPLKDSINPLLIQLDLLPKKRSQIDSKTISATDAYDYFETVKETADSSLNLMIDQVAGYPMTQRLYGILVLAQEQNASMLIRGIILQALFEEKISQANYSLLMQEIGKQSAAAEIYYDISIAEEEATYKQNIKKDSWITSQRYLESFLTKGFSGPYGFTPQEWIKSQNEKIDLFFDDINAILAFNRTALDQEYAKYKSTLYLTLAITIAILGVVLTMVLFSLRGLAKKLEDEVAVLSTSGEEILRSISEASSGMVETATAVTETTTTVEELKQTAQIATEKAKNVADVSEEALGTLKNSETTIADTIQWMNRINEGMGTISDSILKLSEHGKMIGEIIDAVNDLAEQSHLLAVNAAIEAAKAGDQGKGFSVVAQEVRSLADQSKQATVQVRNILNDIQNATNAAVMATEQGSKAVSHGLAQSAQTNDSIRSLALGINNVAQAASQISLSSQQQLIGVNQVTIAMSNIKTASDQQVDHMRQIEGGVQGMNAVGKSLKEQVVEYKL